RARFVPRYVALAIAIVIVLGVTGAVIFVLARNFGAFAANADLYGARIDDLAAQIYERLGLPGAPPTLGQAIARVDPARLVGAIGAGVQNVAANVIFILIYLGFMFSAAAVMPRKLDVIFPDPKHRAHAGDVLDAIRTSIDRYLYVQTLMSLLICTLTFASLEAIGLENTLFWTFLIFFLNYIPTVGSIVAVALPTAFALVQFPDLARVAAVAASIGVWQFVIGNFVQPRMTGQSLNLSAVVVLLALAIWGAIWGITGAFLAAPLTVMIVIVCAQFSSTRWIAVLLSADARPGIATTRAAHADPEKADEA
ncbi:MAG: AI-2E family transporter, partial [Hyphomonadaceae bacterium]